MKDMVFLITSLIFTPEIFILMRKSMGPRGPGAIYFGITWNLVKEQLLHNFMKYFSGPWANQIVNKNLNDESSCFSNCHFQLCKKWCLQNFYSVKKTDDAFETMTLLINLVLICRFQDINFMFWSLYMIREISTVCENMVLENLN